MYVLRYLHFFCPSLLVLATVQKLSLDIIALISIYDHDRVDKPRIYKGGWTERAFILCKFNKSQLESSKSVGIHRQ